MKTSPAQLGLALAATLLGVAGGSGCKGTGQSGCGGDDVTGSPDVMLVPDEEPFGPTTPCELDLDFGDVPIGLSLSAVSQIKNNGDGGVLELSLLNPTLDPEFSLSYGVPPSIQPGSSDQFSVTFQPTKVGQVTSRFTIQTDGINPKCPAPTDPCMGNAITVTLTGNGILINLVVQPNVLDFGNAFISATVKKSVMLVNKSNAAVNGITATVSGGDANLFVVDNVPVTLAAGASATVDISYTPLKLETRSLASVELLGDDGGKATLNLFGEPVDVALTEAPNPIDFGFVPLMTTVVGCTTVSNQANVPVSITDVSSFANEGGAFAEATMDDATPPNPYTFPSTTAPLVIDGGASGKVCFQLTPSASMQYSGQATLVTDDPSGTNPVLTLAGWGGGPQISCTPPSVDFGPTPTHGITTVPVICTNVGSAIPETNLTIDPPTASPVVFSAQFDEAKDIYPLEGLAPGLSVQIDVSYAPTTTSNDVGTLTVVSNGGRGQPVQIPLSGQGVLP